MTAALLLALAASPARAAEIAPAGGAFTGAGTPWTVGAGNGAVGLFRPLTVGLGADDEVTVGTTLGVGLLAPRVEWKHALAARPAGVDGLAVTAELGVPTWGMRQFQTGFLQPIRADQTVPVAVVAGGSVIGGWRAGDHAVSAGLRARVGLAGEGDVTAQDLVWLDPAIAPVTEGWSLQPWVRADWVPAPAWHLGAQVRAEVAGGVEVQARVAAERALGSHVVVGLGAAGALAREPWGWNVPLVVPLQLLPTFDVQARW
jgi:hypothetical protein